MQVSKLCQTRAKMISQQQKPVFLTAKSRRGTFKDLIFLLNLSYILYVFYMTENLIYI